MNPLIVFAIFGFLYSAAVVVSTLVIVAVWRCLDRKRRTAPLGYRILLGDRSAETGRLGGVSPPGSIAAVQRFLEALVNHRREVVLSGLPKPPLLSYRGDFRRIIADQPALGLIASLERGGETRRLALWLLGYCDRHFVTSDVARYGRDPRVAIRKTAARSLRRLSAVPEMIDLAKRETNSVVLQLLGPPTPRTFDERLSTFLGDGKSAARHSGHPATREVFIVEPLIGRPPRPASYFRRLLEHIRRLVRGNGHNGLRSR
jgi:hypothetical protein